MVAQDTGLVKTPKYSKISQELPMSKSPNKGSKKGPKNSKQNQGNASAKKAKNGGKKK